MYRGKDPLRESPFGQLTSPVLATTSGTVIAQRALFSDPAVSDENISEK
jgi:hypothetical protein